MTSFLFSNESLGPLTFVIFKGPGRCGRLAEGGILWPQKRNVYTLCPTWNCQSLKILLCLCFLVFSSIFLDLFKESVQKALVVVLKPQAYHGI